MDAPFLGSFLVRYKYLVAGLDSVFIYLKKYFRNVWRVLLCV